MPPKLPPVPAAAPTDGPSASVMDRWKSNVDAAPAPAPAKKRTGCAHTNAHDATAPLLSL